MKAFLAFALLAFSLSHSLDYSTLEMQAIDQNGNPAEGVNFFLKCKMTFTTVERFLCTSGRNGTCKSRCMDCAPGEEAIVRAAYGNQSIEQAIPSWAGSDAESCKPFYPPSNRLGTFVVTVEEPPEAEAPPVSEIEGSQENLPENVNIETKDYHLSTNQGEYEYVSYVNTSKKREEEAASRDAGCLPFFAILSVLGFFASGLRG